jgi:hypothetical protein
MVTTKNKIDSPDLNCPKNSNCIIVNPLTPSDSLDYFLSQIPGNEISKEDLKWLVKENPRGCLGKLIKDSILKSELKKFLDDKPQLQEQDYDEQLRSLIKEMPKSLSTKIDDAVKGNAAKIKKAMCDTLVEHDLFKNFSVGSFQTLSVIIGIYKNIKDKDTALT